MKRIENELCKLGSVVLIFVIFALSMINIKAEEQIINSDNSGNTTVTATRASTFNVQIPKTVSLGNKTEQIYSISAVGNIEDNEYITVALNKTDITMTNGSGSVSTATASLNNSNMVEFNNENGLNNSTFTSSNGKVVFTETRAGNWSGTITFNVSLNRHIIDTTNIYAKLYSDGSLIFSNSAKAEADKNLVKDYGNLKDTNYSTAWENEKTQIKSVTFINKVTPLNTEEWFANCSNLTVVNNLENLDLSQTDSLVRTFANCSSLTFLNLNLLDFSTIKNINSLCEGCTKLTSIQMDKIDTKNLENSSYAFSMTGIRDIDISSWNVEKLKDASYMFALCGNLSVTGDLGRWKPSCAEDFSFMFDNCWLLSDVGMIEDWKLYFPSTFNSLCMFNQCSNFTNQPSWYYG